MNYSCSNNLPELALFYHKVGHLSIRKNISTVKLVVTATQAKEHRDTEPFYPKRETNDRW